MEIALFILLGLVVGFLAGYFWCLMRTAIILARLSAPALKTLADKVAAKRGNE